MSLKFRSANLDFGAGHDRAYLEHLAGDDVDVLLLQEARTAGRRGGAPLVIADLLPPGWTSLQNTRDTAHAGSCIAVRDTTVRVLWHDTVLGTNPHGERLQPRHIARAGIQERTTGRRVRAISAHEPPGRYRWLQPGYTRRLRASYAGARHGVVIGTDANQRLNSLGRKLGLAVHGERHGRGIVGILTDRLVVPGSLQVGTWGESHGATDHPAVTVTVDL